MSFAVLQLEPPDSTLLDNETVKTLVTLRPVAADRLFSNLWMIGGIFGLLRIRHI